MRSLARGSSQAGGALLRASRPLAVSGASSGQRTVRGRLAKPPVGRSAASQFPSATATLRLKPDVPRVRGPNGIPRRSLRVIALGGYQREAPFQGHTSWEICRYTHSRVGPPRGARACQPIWTTCWG